MSITISDTTPRVQYTAANTQTTFAVGFEFFTNEDLKVFAGSSLLTYAATPANAAQYSVSGAGVSGGGSITLGAASTNGVIYTIYRDMAVERSTDFPTSGAFQIGSLNTELDKVVAMIQQVERDLKFSPQAAANTSNTFGLIFPNLSANKILSVNSAGTALEFSQSITDVATVANISSNITAVGNIASNVTSVAGNATNINLVAGSIGSVNTVAADIAKVVAVANDLAEAVSEVETVANDLNETTSEIEVVAAAIANVDIVGNAVSNVNAVAGAITNINNLNASNVITNIGVVAGIAADVTAVKNISSDIQAVEDIKANVTTVAGMSGAITTINNSAPAINAVNANATNINIVAAANTNVNNVGNAIAAINNVNTNLTAVNNFADQYRIASSAPTTSLTVGDLYFDTTANELKVYKSSGWAAAGSTVNGTSARFNYIATANQTTFTGADTAGLTLGYDAGFADCYLNGVKLSGADITITSGTSVVLASGATVGDVLDIIAYGTFNVAAVAGTAINSGTINDARLPTTMAGKTLTTATVTGTINAETLISKGDGSSADGKITLNCSQNTHGVKIQSPAHSSAQDYTLVLPTSVGTNGQVLATNGNATNQLSWVNAVETKPTISSGNIYIAPSTGVTFTLAGANFASIPIVEFITSAGAITRATAVTFTNTGSLDITTNLANGAYKVRVENPDGNAGVSSGQIINASSAPTWSTAQALGAFAGNASGTLVTLSASSDSTVSYAEVGSNLTTGNMTLSGANITTTDFGGSSTSPTQYTFTIRATDAEGQYLDRQFTINSSFGATGGGQFN